ncbi:MAG TPA: caspase family protein [Blastocatellia bacterium]|nr:caspase family protein [Blastocatellia bacterium]
MNISSALRIAVMTPLVLIAAFSRSDVVAPAALAQESCLLRGRGEVGTILTTARPFDRWALVIGVSRFQYGDKEVGGRQISNLRGPENDARAIRDFLLTPEGGEFPPDHIRIARNEEATRSAVIAGLEWLRGVAKPDDYFVIFFASHGDVEENAGREVPYFIVHDTDPRDFANTAVKMDDFFETIKHMRARRGLALVDTCHSAGIVSGVRGGSNRASALLDQELGKLSAGIGVLVSCKQNQKSFEDVENGVFTWAVIEGLRSYADRDNDGIVRLFELADYVRARVPERQERRQLPPQNPDYFKPVGAGADELPLSIVGALRDPSNAPTRFGAMVIRVPELDDVEISINGCSIGKVGSRRERVIRAPIGEHQLLFTKGDLKLEERVSVEADESANIEVNLAFSRSDQMSFVAPPRGQKNIYLAGKASPEAALNLMKEGIAKYDRQDFKAARSKFDRAVAAGGGSEALVYLGRAQQSLGLKDDAINSFSRALELKPSDYQTRALLAEAQFNKGQDTNKIIRTLEEIINQHPRYEFPYAVLGDVLFARRDLNGAELWLRRGVSVNPAFAPAHLILANVLMYEDPRKTFVDGEAIRPARPLRESIDESETALRLFKEVSEKEVSLRRSLEHLSISHVIFGGGRYANKEIFAEAHYMVAKAHTRFAIYDPYLPNAERKTHLDQARLHLTEARKLAEKMSEKLRLALTLNTSASNHFHNGAFTEAVADAKAAVKIIETLKKSGPTSLKDEEAESHLTLSRSYEARQEFCLARDHRRRAFEIIGANLNEQDRRLLNEEIADLDGKCKLRGNR